MKGWVGGLVVGAVLGSALAGAAQELGIWQTTAQILKLSGPGNDSFRMGYIEGTSDTLAFVALLPVPKDYWQHHAACLSGHSHGPAEEFSRWTKGIWQSSVDKGYGNDNAAGDLIDGACK